MVVPCLPCYRSNKMTREAQKLLAATLRLPTADRARLAAQIIDSLDAADADDVEVAWAAEVKRRLDEVDEGRAETIPWAEARRQILTTDG